MRTTARHTLPLALALALAPAAASTASAAPAKGAKQGPGVEDPIPVELAREAGVRHCLEAVELASDSIIAGRTPADPLLIHGAWSSWHTDEPDKRMYVSTVARPFNDGSTLSVITVSHDVGGGCSAMITTSYTEPMACTLARAQTFGSLSSGGMLNEDTQVLVTADEGKRFFLAPQGEDGASCLVTSVEMLYTDG
jgi:hypothetical protein